MTHLVNLVPNKPDCIKNAMNQLRAHMCDNGCKDVDATITTTEKTLLNALYKKDPDKPTIVSLNKDGLNYLIAADRTNLNVSVFD